MGMGWDARMSCSSSRAASPSVRPKFIRSITMLRLAIQRLGLVVSSQLGQNDAERCQGPGQLGQEDVEVSLSQTADDGQPGLIVLGGAGRVPRRHREVAQPLAANAQVPLPPGRLNHYKRKEYIQPQTSSSSHK